MPLPSTMTPIATITLASASATITFSSIPQTYTDLMLASVWGPTAGDDLYLQFNGDTGSNYSTTWMSGNGSAVASGRKTSDTGVQPRTSINQPATVTTIYNVDIINYSNTTTYKTTLGKYRYTAGLAEMDAGLWRNTAAITSLTFRCNASTFIAGSTFTLYGIKAA